MDKREEIREGIKTLIAIEQSNGEFNGNRLTQKILELEDSVKVVMIVDSEFPENVVAEIDEIADRYALRPNYAKDLIGKILEDAGYVAIERLIKE